MNVWGPARPFQTVGRCPQSIRRTKAPKRSGRQNGFSEDFDRDGRSNFSEWIFGTNPKSGTALNDLQITRDLVPGYVTVRYNPVVPGLTYQLQLGILAPSEQVVMAGDAKHRACFGKNSL